MPVHAIVAVELTNEQSVMNNPTHTHTHKVKEKK